MNTPHDLDNMRSGWQKIGSMRHKEPDSARRMINFIKKDYTKSITDRLARRFLVIAICGLIVIPVESVLMFNDNLINLAVCICMVVYGLIGGATAVIMYAKIHKPDYLALPATEVLRRIYSFAKLRANFQRLLIVLMVPLLALLLISFYHVNIHIFYGGLAGAAIGAVIGLLMEYRIRRDIRSLTALYNEMIDPEL